MGKKRVSKYPKAFRVMAVERVRSCENVSALAKELGVDLTVLYNWRNLSDPRVLPSHREVAGGASQKKANLCLRSARLRG